MRPSLRRRLPTERVKKHRAPRAPRLVRLAPTSDLRDFNIPNHYLIPATWPEMHRAGR